MIKLGVINVDKHAQWTGSPPLQSLANELQGKGFQGSIRRHYDGYYFDNIHLTLVNFKKRLFIQESGTAQDIANFMVELNEFYKGEYK